MAAKLHAVPASHPCATVEAALQAKGIAFERVDWAPALHKAVQKLRFGGGTVPGIVFDDGEKVLGSKAILRALDRRSPEPPLLPSDPQARAAVEAAESWGDEDLQSVVRRVLWHALSADTGAQLSYLEGARIKPPLPRPAVKAGGGAVAFLERRFNAVDDAAVREDLRRLPEMLDRIDGLLGDGTLGTGGHPNAADLQIAASVRLLLTLEDLAPAVDGRPAGAHARHWFPQYPGRVPAGALSGVAPAA